jgi:hypothetical protein
MFDQLSADILASLIKGFPRTTTTTTTKQNVDPAVYYVYSRVKSSRKMDTLVRIIKFIFQISIITNNATAYVEETLLSSIVSLHILVMNSLISFTFNLRAKKLNTFANFETPAKIVLSELFFGRLKGYVDFFCHFLLSVIIQSKLTKDKSVQL